MKKYIVNYGEIEFHMSKRKFWFYIALAIFIVLTFGDWIK